MLEKIALGSAQFGMEYGISNRVGKVLKEDVFRILESARQKGIHTLDTAYSYGESEIIIGEFISGSGLNFDIVSKLPDSNDDISATEKYCLETLRRLRQREIYGYLIHKFENLIRHKELWQELESLKRKKLVRKIGISIYRPEELEYLWNNDIRFDILQIPYNIFDQRFAKYLYELKKKSVEIHIRSAFLQGLFFLEMDEINKNFQSAKKGIEKLHRISEDYEIPLHSLCLCFVLLNPSIDKVIIGVDSIEQLKQNIESIKYLDKTRSIYNVLQSLKSHDEEVILPYNWRL